MLITTKILLGLNVDDHSEDERINAYCEIMAQKAKNYCNIPAIPPGLKEIVAEMAAALYRRQTAASATVQATAGMVKKETVGNHTVEYVTDSTANSEGSVTADILSSHASLLNPFRRPRFV